MIRGSVKHTLIAVAVIVACSTSRLHGNELFSNTLCMTGLDDTYSSIQPIQGEVWVSLWDRVYVTTTGCVDVLVPSDHADGHLLIYSEGFDLIDLWVPPGVEEKGAMYVIEMERRFWL